MDDPQLNADKPATIPVRVGTLEERFADLETQVSDLAQRGLAAAETGSFGAVAKEGGGIIQEMVDFLHRLFPGHGAPGVPTSAPVLVAPSSPVPVIVTAGPAAGGAGGTL
jgi:hypothetical protein